MDEGDLHVVGAGARGFVDHSKAGLFELGDAGREVVDREGQMVQAFAALVEERLNGTCRIGRLQELEMRFPNREACTNRVVNSSAVV